VLVPLLDVLLSVVLFELALFQAPDCLCLERRVDVPGATRALPLAEATQIDVTESELLVDGTPTDLDALGARLGARRRMVLIFADRHLPMGRVEAVATRARRHGIGLAVRQSR